MLPQWIIEKKRDGKPLSEEEIREFIAKYAVGDIPDYQAALRFLPNRTPAAKLQGHNAF